MINLVLEIRESQLKDSHIGERHMNINIDKLFIIREIYWHIPNLQKETSEREEKIDLAKLRKSIEFVAEKLFMSIYKSKWKKIKLSEKQIACIDRAEQEIRNSKFYISNNSIHNLISKYDVN
jgi:hypothetical protein